MIIPEGYSNVTFVIARTGDLDPYTTSFGVELSAPEGFDPTEADTVATALANAAKPNLTSVDTVTEIDWAYNTGLGVTQHVSVTNAVGTLASAASQMPQNNALLIQKRSAFPGRKGRGRMYWPGIVESEVDAVGLVGSPAITRMTTMLTSWKNTVTASAMLNVTVLFHSTGDPSTSVPYPVNLSCSNLLATQRRRLRK